MQIDRQGWKMHYMFDFSVKNRKGDSNGLPATVSYKPQLC